jgi:hypothetical protein
LLIEQWHSVPAFDLDRDLQSTTPVSRANLTADQAKLPIIVRGGLCGHRRLRKHGSPQAASTPRRATRKSERRIARRSGL